ncbi:unnamed protein product, partial [Ectocarpus sp. 12 AP-2014]
GCWAVGGGSGDTAAIVPAPEDRRGRSPLRAAVRGCHAQVRAPVRQRVRGGGAGTVVRRQRRRRRRRARRGRWVRIPWFRRRQRRHGSRGQPEAVVVFFAGEQGAVPLPSQLPLQPRRGVPAPPLVPRALLLRRRRPRRRRPFDGDGGLRGIDPRQEGGVLPPGQGPAGSRRRRPGDGAGGGAEGRLPSPQARGGERPRRDNPLSRPERVGLSGRRHPRAAVS